MQIAGHFSVQINSDIHLASMIAYFAMTAEGVPALSGRRRLSRWWTHMQEYPSVVATDPGLPKCESSMR